MSSSQQAVSIPVGGIEHGGIVVRNAIHVPTINLAGGIRIRFTKPSASAVVLKVPDKSTSTFELRAVEKPHASLESSETMCE